MTKTTFIDPPSGWRYGFPKPIPDDWGDLTPEGRVHWFLNNGYPQCLIDQGSLKYCNIYSGDLI